MRQITEEQLKEILEKHRKWLNNENDGERADLRDTDLSYAVLSSADLSYAVLSYADLSHANLGNANMSYADLQYAVLGHANLSYAKTDKRYLQISCIGSRKGITTYCFEDDTIFCGCIKGTLKDFIGKVKETYPDKKNIHRIEYDAFISMINKIKKLEG